MMRAPEAKHDSPRRHTTRVGTTLSAADYRLLKIIPTLDERLLRLESKMRQPIEIVDAWQITTQLPAPANFGWNKIWPNIRVLL